jgi:hypothetical protein
VHHENVMADPPERVADAYARFADLRAPQPRDPWPSGRFLLTRDGRSVVWTDPRGTSIDWLR